MIVPNKTLREKIERFVRSMHERVAEQPQPPLDLHHHASSRRPHDRRPGRADEYHSYDRRSRSPVDSLRSRSYSRSLSRASSTAAHQLCRPHMRCSCADPMPVIRSEVPTTFVCLFPRSAAASPARRDDRARRHVSTPSPRTLSALHHHASLDSSVRVCRCAERKASKRPAADGDGTVSAEAGADGALSSGGGKRRRADSEVIEAKAALAAVAAVGRCRGFRSARRSLTRPGTAQPV